MAARQPQDSKSVLGGILLLAGLIFFIVALIKGLWLLLGLAFLALIVIVVVMGRVNKGRYAKMPKDKT